MFRFATPDVSPSTKPRGLVDLSKVSTPLLSVDLYSRSWLFVSRDKALLACHSFESKF